MLNKKISNIEFVVFDVETTGLSFLSGDRVIEIAAIKTKNHKTLSTFSSLINSGYPVSPGALEVNHITSHMLEKAPKPFEVIPKFLEFIQDACICAYNANFDTGFLINELNLLNLCLNEGQPILDILLMARKLFPGLGRYPLWNVAGRLGINQLQVHRAMKDVEITAQIFNKAVALLNSKNIHNFIEMQSLFGINPKLSGTLENQKTSSIQRAMDLGLKVKIKYYSKSSGLVTQREVKPKEIKQEKKHKYLVGFCHLRNEDRTFNLNEILEINIV